MDHELSAEALANLLKGLNIREINVEMTALIRSGEIGIGTKLPAVRDLAEHLGMSPSSISTAWQVLKKNNLISGNGRRGVWVSDNNPSPRPIRFETVGNFRNNVKIDLTYSGPDPVLLPRLEDALIFGYQSESINSYQRQAITPCLSSAVRKYWPYEAEALVATNGGFDALQATLNALIQPGSYVAVEDPTAVRLLDLIDNLGARILSVPCDDEGPIPEALAQALENKVSAFIYQPRSHSVCGTSVSQDRLNTLAPLLENVGVIIEDDGLGDISPSPAMTLGHDYPERVVHIRSYSKSLGPDLRLAVLSTSKGFARQIQDYRNYGASWTSRILQNAAAYLLNDVACQMKIIQARDVYRGRRQSLTEALTQRGIVWTGSEGLSVWIPVPSEQFALVTMALHGYAVSHGENFMSNNHHQSPHIRVATSCLTPEQIAPLADTIALCFDIE